MLLHGHLTFAKPAKISHSIFANVQANSRFAMVRMASGNPDMGCSQWIMGSCDCWEFSVFQRPLTVPLHSPNDRRCLPLVLCKETVKKSSGGATDAMLGMAYYTQHWWIPNLQTGLHASPHQKYAIMCQNWTRIWPMILAVASVYCGMLSLTI